MGVSWGTIKSLSLFFGPILIPKALKYYRSVRAAPGRQGVPIRAVPPTVSRALAILFITSLCYFIKTLPPFAPENLFALTQSRLQISTDVLFTRLAALRPAGLTPSDELLRSKFTSMDNRLLYFQYGPDVLASCTFCTSEETNSYLYYALPALIAPHLFNLCILAVVTSGFLVGKEGAIWRTTSVFASVGILLADAYLVSSYSYQDNSRATRPQDIDTFFWKSRMYRLMALAALNVLLGWIMYLSSTNRAFLKPLTTNERIETTTRVLEEVRGKLSAVQILKNTVQRDDDLRARSDLYWRSEVRIMGEAMEEREVIEGVNNALENRLNIATISTDAETYAQHVVAPLQASLELVKSSVGLANEDA